MSTAWRSGHPRRISTMPVYRRFSRSSPAGVGAAAPRGVELTSIAATVKALTWPADMAGDERRATVSRLLIESEVAVPAGDGIRFVNVGVQAYLAARHMVRRAPRGPCWWRPSTWHWLRPGVDWPDTGVMLFLVALWWRDAQPTMERRLRRLFADGDRERNASFINQLGSSPVQLHISPVPLGSLKKHTDPTGQRWYSIGRAIVPRQVSRDPQHRRRDGGGRHGGPLPPARTQPGQAGGAGETRDSFDPPQ